MKKISFSFLLLVLSLPLFSQNSMVTVITPNGGENWTIGCPYAVQWVSATPTPVKIELYKNGVFCLTICSQVPAGMSTYTWIPPYTLAAANTYKVKVTCLTNIAGFDFSNNEFSINPGNITVVSPNGGETWQKGSTHQILWTDNVCENVRIELWKGGVYNSLITPSTPSIGNFTWAIPNNNTLVPGNDYKIKIMVQNNSATTNTVYDFSDANFTIGSPQCLTLLVPNGGEVWFTGSSYQISWIACFSGNIRIELWKGGIFNSLICASATGPYTWTIPAATVPGNNYRIKIIGVNSSNTNVDLSDADFTINQGSFIIVTSPNGGEAWVRGTTHFLTWQDNIPQDVRIELWKGGVLNSVINPMTPSNGSCYWAIPITQAGGTDYKVKILAIGNSGTTSIFDFSDNNFSILSSNAGPNTQKPVLQSLSGTGIKAYPNPCNNFLHVETGEETGFTGSIEMMNVMGKTVLKQDVRENPTSVMDIATTQLTEGFYILLVRKDNEIVFKSSLIIRH
jgi:hypothetical protein